MRKLLLILPIILLTVLLSAQSKGYPSLQEYITLKTPASPVISPDGKKVVYTARIPDLKKSKWTTNVFGVDVATKKYTLLTSMEFNASNPSFTADSKNILYLSSEKGDVKQLFMKPYGGSGKATALGKFKTDVEEYTLSPSGNLMAIITTVYDEKAEKEQAARAAVKNDETVYPKSNPAKVLNIYDMKSKKVTGSFTVDPGAERFRWAPSEDHLVFQTNMTGEYNDEQKTDIKKITLKGEISVVVANEGPETQPQYSPNGKILAYRTQTVPDVEFAETDLIIKEEGKAPVNLTKDFDFSIQSYVWKNDNIIVAIVGHGTDNTLFEYNLENMTFSPVSNIRESIADVTFSTNGTLCFRKETSTEVNEIYVNGSKITSFNDQIAAFPKHTQEVITWKSKDGKFDIEGILFKPAGFDASKKYPLILTVHGGPYGNFRNVWHQSYPIQYLLNKGYVVLAPNPRGSSGYSDLFSNANRYDLGGGDYNDIMAGVDYCIQKGFVDENKMGVTGGSYGGYLTNWIISQNNRFKAAVSMYGIYSFLTDWSNSFQPSFEKMYFGYYYWEKPIDMNNLYISRSPAFYTKNIKTPTLILQGEKDPYTDISNSREMYQALKTTGTPVNFVVYPREGHGIGNEPNHRINAMTRLVDWFESYLK